MTTHLSIGNLSFTALDIFDNNVGSRGSVFWGAAAPCPARTVKRLFKI